MGNEIHSHNTVGHILSKGAAWLTLRERTESAVG